jgi:hypothetical protein
VVETVLESFEVWGSPVDELTVAVFSIVPPVEGRDDRDRDRLASPTARSAWVQVTVPRTFSQSHPSPEAETKPVPAEACPTR